MKDYHINIFYSETDRGYIVDIPDLDACSAFGKTPAETLKQAEVAKRTWLAAARAEKNRFPNRVIALPSIKPAHNKTNIQAACRLASKLAMTPGYTK